MKVIYSQSEIVVGHTVRFKWLDCSKIKATWGGRHSFDGVKVSRTITAHASTNLDDQVQWAADTFMGWLNDRLPLNPVQEIKRITIAYLNPDERALVIEVQDAGEQL